MGWRYYTIGQIRHPVKVRRRGHRWWRVLAAALTGRWEWADDPD